MKGSQILDMDMFITLVGSRVSYGIGDRYQKPVEGWYLRKNLLQSILKVFKTGHISQACILGILK